MKFGFSTLILEDALTCEGFIWSYSAKVSHFEVLSDLSICLKSIPAQYD